MFYIYIVPTSSYVVSLPMPPTNSCMLTVELWSVSNSLKRFSAKPYLHTSKKIPHSAETYIHVQYTHPNTHIYACLEPIAQIYLLTSHSLAAHLKSRSDTRPCFPMRVNVPLNHSKTCDSSSSKSCCLSSCSAGVVEVLS